MLVDLKLWLVPLTENLFLIIMSSAKARRGFAGRLGICFMHWEDSGRSKWLGVLLTVIRSRCFGLNQTTRAAITTYRFRVRRF